MNKLDVHINNICSRIKQFSPDAMIEISKEPYETEDASLDVYMPESSEKWVDFYLELCGETARINREEGYQILVLMHSDRQGSKVN